MSSRGSARPPRSTLRSRWLGLGGAAAALAVLAGALVVTQHEGDARAGAPATPAAASTATPTGGAAGPTTRAPRPASASTTAAPSVVATPTPVPPVPTATAGRHRTLAPVPLAGSATPMAHVRARLVSVRSTTARSELPGETSGAALEVVVGISNDTTHAVDLSAGVVNLYLGADRTPAVPVDSAGTPLPTSVPAGGSVRGTFLFRVRPGEGRSMTAEVDLGAAGDVVLFQGPRPGQSR